MMKKQLNKEKYVCHPKLMDIAYNRQIGLRKSFPYQLKADTNTNSMILNLNKNSII